MTCAVAALLGADVLCTDGEPATQLNLLANLGALLPASIGIRDVGGARETGASRHGGDARRPSRGAARADAGEGQVEPTRATVAAAATGGGREPSCAEGGREAAAAGSEGDGEAGGQAGGSVTVAPLRWGDAGQLAAAMAAAGFDAHVRPGAGGGSGGMRTEL